MRESESPEGMEGEAGEGAARLTVVSNRRNHARSLEKAYERQPAIKQRFLGLGRLRSSATGAFEHFDDAAVHALRRPRIGGRAGSDRLTGEEVLFIRTSTKRCPENWRWGDFLGF